MPYSTTRILIAGVVAPIVGMTVAWALAVADATLALGEDWSTAIRGFLHSMFFIVFFGAPVSYVVEAAVGVPAFRWMNGRARVTLVHVVGIAGMTGSALWTATWCAITHVESGEYADLVAQGLAGGAAAGLTSWLIGFAAITPRRAA